MPKRKTQRRKLTTHAQPKTVQLRPVRICTKEEDSISQKLDRVEKKLDELREEMTARFDLIEKFMKIWDQQDIISKLFGINSSSQDETAKASNEQFAEHATDVSSPEPQAIPDVDSSPASSTIDSPETPLPSQEALSSSKRTRTDESNDIQRDGRSDDRNGNNGSDANSIRDTVSPHVLPSSHSNKKRRTNRKPVIIPAPSTASTIPVSSLPTPALTPSPGETSPPPSIPYFPVGFNITTVIDVWQEWDVGLTQGCAALKTLEKYYGDSWCHNSAIRRIFSQRKYIVNEIMRLAERDNISHQDAAQELEAYRLRSGFDLSDLADHLRLHQRSEQNAKDGQ